MFSDQRNEQFSINIIGERSSASERESRNILKQMRTRRAPGTEIIRDMIMALDGPGKEKLIMLFKI